MTKELSFPYTFNEENLYVNFSFPELGVVFAGLNSCFDESEQELHYGNITVDQLKKACQELNTHDPKRELLRVAVMHHNFVRLSNEDQENLKDADDLKPRLLDEKFSLILHGHLHKVKTEVTGAGNDIIHVLATGSSGLDAETLPKNSRRYQVIEIENGRVRVYRRWF